MGNFDDLEEMKNKAVEFAKLLTQFELTYAPLRDDLSFSIQQWHVAKKSPFWSRTSIRCLCAAVEAALFGYRKTAERMGDLSKTKFDPDESEILSGIQIRKGVQKPKWLSPGDSVKESFRLFGKAVGCSVVVNYGEAGFSDLCDTFKVRNRLMHPKEPLDVTVNAKDIETADRAISWFNKTFASVIEQCQVQIDKKVKSLKKQQ
jgi:hypothetical protein